jgi:hypothetical protein
MSTCEVCGCINRGSCIYADVEDVISRSNDIVKLNKCDDCKSLCQGLCAKINDECSRCGNKDNMLHPALCYYNGRRLTATYACSECKLRNYGDK